MNDAVLQKIVLDCLVGNYGLRGKLARLSGENLNFLLTTPKGTRYVFKIVDAHMPPASVQMEFEAIEFAVTAGFKPALPRIIENSYGNIETGISLPINGVHRSRLIHFIDGTEMSELTDISDFLLSNLGRTVAEFNLAMQGFDHPAAHRNHRWNLAEAEQHEGKISLIGDAEYQRLLKWAFTGWREVKKVFPELPWQFIHGDAHDENILVEGDRVIGLIDFGDCCHNPAVCELAICMTYLMMRGDEPVRIARLLADGYQAVRPLSTSEISLLYPLVCARLAVSLCVANQRKTIDPGNPNWFGGEGACWKLLMHLRELGPEAFSLALRS